MDHVVRQIPVAKINDLEELQILRVEPQGLPPIAIYRIGDKFFATDDTCSHGEASLAEGLLCEDFSIECPFHGGKFDVRDGRAVALPCTEGIRSYPVVVRGDTLYLDLVRRHVNDET